MIAGIDYSLVMSFPTYLPGIILFLGLLAYIVTKNKHCFLLGLCLAVLIPLSHLSTTAGMHRIALSFLLILGFLYCNMRKQYEYNWGFLFCEIMFMSAFVLAYSTLAVSMGTFFLCLFIIQAIKYRKFSMSILLYFIFVVYYYLFVNNFLSKPIEIVFETIHYAKYLNPLKLYDIPKTIDLIPSVDSHLVLLNYLVIGAIISLFIFYYLDRFKHYLSCHKFEVEDEIFVPFLLLILGSLFFRMSIGIISGGINPVFLLYLLASPICVLAILRIKTKYLHKRKSSARLSYGVLVLAFLILISVNTFSHLDVYPTSATYVTNEDVKVSQWLGHTREDDTIVISDFNYLSTYQAITGPISDYTPLSSVVAVDVGEKKYQPIIDTYYTLDKENLNGKGDLYVVNQKMADTQIFTIGGFPIRANPYISNSLSNSNSLIYNNNNNVFYLE